MIILLDILTVYAVIMYCLYSILTLQCHYFIVYLCIVLLCIMVSVCIGMRYMMTRCVLYLIMYNERAYSLAYMITY